MIKLENYEVVGWGHAIRGMRNPMNSWDRSDSYVRNCDSMDCDECMYHREVDGVGRIPCGGQVSPFTFNAIPKLGNNDHELMMKLAKGGPVHAKYRRMITVYVDITAPLYWWKEFDTYKVGTVANSCSTMHKIHAKEFTLEDFSCEHLIDGIVSAKNPNGIDEHSKIATNPLNVLRGVIDSLNCCRLAYLECKDGRTQFDAIDAKDYWEQMIQLLPTSYNQKRTVMLNYEVLNNIYPTRKNHKLDEWRAFCDWIEKLPYSELITGNLNKKPDFTNHDGSHDYD